VNPFNLKSTLNYDTVTGSAHYSVLNDMIGSMIIDQHDALLAAWNKINDVAKISGVSNATIDAAKAALSVAPISQQQADQYGTRWQDQVFRNQQITMWRQFATSKYNNATTLANKAVSDAQAAAAAAQAAATAAAQQQQMMYIGGGVVVMVLIAVGAYAALKRKKEVEAVKK